MRAAAAVAERDIVALTSSPLERAIETATPVAEQFDLAIGIERRRVVNKIAPAHRRAQHRPLAEQPRGVGDRER